jgi:DNA-binding NarL/FixJ family response regulator
LIRVRIETESAVTRAGLEALLQDQPGIEITHSRSAADVIIAEDIAEADAPVVLLTDEASVRDALDAGVRGILPTNAAPAQIVAAIHAVSAGLIAVPAEESASVLPRLAAEPMAEPLSPREAEVLDMLAEGLSNKEIAHRLAISEHTAKFHVNSILTKLNAGTRTEAVTRGIRLGLIKI